MFCLLYLFVYYNIDNILNRLYLSKQICVDNEVIIQNPEFYYSVTQINIYVLILYSIYIIKNIVDYKSIDRYSFLLALVYMKYSLSFFFTENITLCQYEFSRHIMWLFATPLMIQMYCDANNIKIQTMNLQYHIIPVTINIFIYPYKQTPIYFYFTAISWVLMSVFVKTLYKNLNLQFTNIFLFIWGIFMCINIIELLNITNQYNINMYYLIADVMSKITTNIIINGYNERELLQKKNMDLQAINFVSYLIKHIQKYKEDNANITERCKKFIDFTLHRLLVKIPENKLELSQELLHKILPLGFADTYKSAIPKQFTMICILFTDIVNYTELAKKYEDKVIFDLLNDVYNKFDNITKKYAHLQKIETIGDAYMIVGDIYRTTTNHKMVIKELIELAFDFLKEVKHIKTPDKNPLSIRIGINIGNVSIGVLGNEIPRLCVVGNAVNVASRLQTTADKDTIQMSRHIYEQLDEIDFDMKFEVKEKENVFLKNIGSITTYNITPTPHL